jgi:SPW repeat.
VLGAAIAIFAGTAVYMPKAWEEAVSIVLGLCLLASPWVMGFADHSAAMGNAVTLGVLVVAFGLWAMLQDADFKKWLEQHRHASGAR